jgi:hypothetical protein
MKKIFAIVLAMILSLSIVACGSSGGNGLTNNPSAEDVKVVLETIDTISDIEIVTEEHDPNGQLNKQGGYTGALYFRDENVPVDELYVEDETKTDSITIGTDGGGSVEIFPNSSDAKKRDEYLAKFDGGALSSGSHKVLGTLVIRTSSLLTGSEQQTLENLIIDALQ